MGYIISRDEPRRGEVWGFRLPNGTQEHIGIIIGYNGNIVTLLRVIDEQNEKHDIEIKYRGLMYGSSRMMQYTFPQNLTSFKKTLNEEEFADILQKIATSLELEQFVNVSNNVESNDESSVISKPLNVDNVKAIMEKDAEIVSLKAQVDVYKDMYNNLLKQMVQK